MGIYSNPDYKDQPRPYRKPGSAIERVLHGIWSSILGRDTFGIDDDFSTLGGSSEAREEIAEQVREVFLLDIATSALFGIPTIAGQAACVEQIRASKAHPVSTIPLVSRAERLPPSFGQQRLWFFDRLLPGSPLYTEGMSLDIHGPLDPEILNRTINEIIRRHEALRTTFDDLKGEVFQVIHPELILPVERIDLQSLSPEQQQMEVRQLTGEQAHLAFDLKHGPLLRAVLIHLAADHVVFLLLIHHIAMDGWSMGILIRELSILYPAFRSGLPPPLPVPTLQYADFSAWQRQRMQGKLLDDHLSYWKQKLFNLPPMLDLPMDRPRSGSFAVPGASHHFMIPQPWIKAIKEYGQRHGATLFMMLLSAFAALLGHLCGQDDFCIGTPVANRNRTEIENLIGLFINMLALRFNLSNDPRFGDLLLQVKQTTLEAYAHQDIPFELLVEKLRPTRSPGSTPFFQVIFILENLNLQPIQIPGLEIHLDEVETGTAKFDISLYCIEQMDGTLACRMEYNADLFNADTIQDISLQFQTVLKAIAEKPEQRIPYLVKNIPATQPGQILPGKEEALPGLPEDREDLFL